MQEIIKQADSSSQLFETVNFAFMKFFDFLVKTALFEAFLLFWGDSCNKLRPKIERGSYVIFSHQARFLSKFVTGITQEKQQGLKKGCFD